MEPILVRSLKHLRKTKGSLTAKSLAETLGEDHSHVEKALEGLFAKGFLKKEGEHYRYVASRKNEALLRKLFHVYERVASRPKIDKLVRGLLAPELPFYFKDPFLSPYFLFHLPSFVRILKAEGFYKEEIKSFLEEEMKKGWMGKFEFYFGSKEEISWPSPMVIHPQHLINEMRFGPLTKEREMIMIYVGKRPPFIYGKSMGTEEFTRFKDEFLQRWKRLGWFVRKEEYVMGQYPRHVAKAALEYVEKERRDLREKIFEGRDRFPF
jgi:hypothetical protein